MRRWKQLGRSPLSWLLIAGLVCANLATLAWFWFLLTEQGLASGAPTGQDAAASRLLMPIPTLTPRPTATATQVFRYEATPTKTPSPTATPEPTATIPAPVPATIAPVKPAAKPTVERVLIISIDGLRPDALFLANTPNLDALIRGGAYSPEAQTVSMSVTLPSHASMLSGMTPDKHGIHWNRPYIGWPGMNGPTLFNVARDAGLETAMIAGKHKFSYINLPDSLDYVYAENTHDPQIRDLALEQIQTGMPDVLFVHFPDVDIVGHEFGWMSENQLFSVNYVDGLIGEIIAELDREGYLATTLLIVTADHGGRDRVHGDDTPEDRTIPWLAAGPGIAQGTTIKSAVNIYDTAATVIHALALPIPEHWDGVPVMEIFE